MPFLCYFIAINRHMCNTGQEIIEMSRKKADNGKEIRRGKGSGTVFKRPNGNYCVQYTDVTGKKKTKVLTVEDPATKKLVPIRIRDKAEAAAKEVIEDYRKIKHADTSEKHLTQVNEYRKVTSHINIPLAQAWDKYVASQSRPASGPRTLESYEKTLNQFSRWVKTNYPTIANVGKIDVRIADAYMSELLVAGISERTYNAYLQALKLVFRILLGVENSAKNPFLYMTKQKEDQQSRKDFTEKQVEDIFATLQDGNPYPMLYKPEMRVMINMCCWTGCRGQDACLMQWNSVSFDNNTISYRPEKTKRRKSSTIITLPLHPQLRAALEDAKSWRTDEKESAFILPNVSERYKKNPTGIYKDISKTLTHIGIETTVEPEEETRRKLHKVVDRDGNEQLVKTRVCQYSMHSFRHTFVSFCANAGVPLAVVQSIVGHGSPAMTRHYTHISQEAAQKAIDALPMHGIQPKSFTVNEIIDVGAIHIDNNLEPERAELMNLISSANISTVRKLLKSLKAK